MRYEPQIDEATVVALDPFSFHGHHIASRIAGLGGDEAPDNPIYAFHTPYVPVERGPAQFRVRFRDLHARLGTLVLRVHMYPDEPGAVASMVNSERIALNRLQKNDGQVTIRFEGFRNINYALMGIVPDNTDAAAEGLDITLERITDPGFREGSAHEDVRSTRFEAKDIRASLHILAMSEPTLAAPVSQPCTASQMAEPVFTRWMARFGAGTEQNPKNWVRAYLAQSLERYGMLQPGATGLGLLATPDPLVGLLAGTGINTTIARIASPDFGVPADAAFDLGISSEAGIALRTFDPDALPDDLVNFDFLWSDDLCTRHERTADAEAFIVAAMTCVRPGGLAIHILRSEPSAHAAATEADPGIFQRHDLDRLAMVLLSRGHDVAQIRPAPDKAPQRLGYTRGAAVPFGIVVRRAPVGF